MSARKTVMLSGETVAATSRPAMSAITATPCGMPGTARLIARPKHTPVNINGKSGPPKYAVDRPQMLSATLPIPSRISATNPSVAAFSMTVGTCDWPENSK